MGRVDGHPGEYELCVRATDASGKTQPLMVKKPGTRADTLSKSSRGSRGSRLEKVRKVGQGKMTTEQQTIERLTQALRQPRYEVIPLPGTEQQVLERVPKEAKLTVTASPEKGMEDTLQLAERLAGQGYRVAPHLAARLIEDNAHLEEILQRLHEVGIRDAFVVGGDAKEPVGGFVGAPELLEAMSEIGHELEEIGITGYPEGHPFLEDETIKEAMYEKRPHATYIVSQICFDPSTTADWIRRVRGRGVELPIYIGVPGAVSKRKLMRISSSIGIGGSADFLKKHGNWFIRLLLPGGYSPEDLVEELGPYLGDPDRGVYGFHIYSFNEVGKTEAWRREMLGRIEAGR
jgi:methylenetetrahydrofolate reductase (NADPH)